jgi:spore germination protein GerM
MALISDPEQAKRLARAIASDLSLYNEQKVVGGIEKDNFFEAMAKEIEEGREHYKSRVSPEIYNKYNFYDRALVDVILSRKKHIKSKIW